MRPIIILHQGTSEYVPFVLLQAKRTNLSSPVVYISDIPTPESLKFVEYVPLEEFKTALDNIDSVQSIADSGKPYFLHVSDMTFLYQFAKSSGLLVGDTACVVEGSAFDNNYTYPHEGYEMDNDVKRTE